MISEQTAFDIACAYREIRTAEELLASVEKEIERPGSGDIRDVFGAKPNGLTLGLLSGSSTKTLYQLPWALAKPVIEANIAHKRAALGVLNAKAAIETTEVREKLFAALKDARLYVEDATEPNTPAATVLARIDELIRMVEPASAKGA